MPVKIIPEKIGALGTTRKSLTCWLEKLGIETRISELQRIIFLHSSKITSKYGWDSKNLFHTKPKADSTDKAFVSVQGLSDNNKTNIEYTQNF